MKLSFLQSVKGKRSFIFLFKILVSSFIFIGSNHCVFEEAYSLLLSITTNENIAHLPNHVGANHPHKHPESSSNESHSHGQSDPMFLLGLSQGIFFILKSIGLILISSLLFSLSFSFIFKKICLELNPSKIFEWDFYKFHSFLQVHSIVSPRAPPAFS